MTRGKYSRTYWVGAFSALGGFLFGYHTGVISGVLVMKDFRRTILNDRNSSEADPTGGFIVGILLLGCFLGSLIGGQTSDRFSRKYSIAFFLHDFHHHELNGLRTRMANSSGFTNGSIGDFNDWNSLLSRWLISRDREEEIERIKTKVAYLREREIQFYRQLFRFPLLLGMGIQILQQLTRINATIYYAPIIFNPLFSNNSLFDPLLATDVQGTVNVLVTIIFIDKLGRRALLITGAMIMTGSMIVLSVITPMSTDQRNDHITCSTQCWASVIFVYTFIGGFGFSWGPVPWVYCAEIFPLTIRAKAISLTTSANWAATFKMDIQDYSSHFLCVCASMIVIIYLFYPETNGIHLERNDIDENDQVFVPQWLE